MTHKPFVTYQACLEMLRISTLSGSVLDPTCIGCGQALDIQQHLNASGLAMQHYESCCFRVLAESVTGEPTEFDGKPSEIRLKETSSILLEAVLCSERYESFNEDCDELTRAEAAYEKAWPVAVEAAKEIDQLQTAEMFKVIDQAIENTEATESEGE